MKLITCLTLLSIQFFSTSLLGALEGYPDGSFSNELSLGQEETIVVDFVKFKGQLRTQPALISARLNIQPGTEVFRRTIEEAVQRLRDTDLFNDIRWGLFQTGEGVTLLFFLKEKWAVLPVIQVDTVGQDVAFQGGLVDFNSFGIGMMNLITYGWYDGYSSVLWIGILPRLERVPLSFMTSFKIDKENIYSRNDKGDVDSGYTLGQFSQKLKMEYWFNDQWSAGPILSWQHDTVTGEYLESSVNLTDRYTALSFGLGAGGFYRNSRIVDYRQVGVLAKLILQPGISTGDREDLFITAESELWYSFLPVNWFHFRGRAKGGYTSAKNPSLWFTGGGFMEIRGLEEGYLNGPLLYLFNVEAAFTLFQTKIIALEAVLFLDIGATPSGFDDLGYKPSIKYGAGLHIPIPAVSAFHLRFDLAWGPESPEPIIVFSVMPLFRSF